MDIEKFLDDAFTDEADFAKELVVNKETGQARQAGTAYGGLNEFVDNFRMLCESSLYYFAKGVQGMDLLTETLHKPTCEWLQACPPRRKLLLLPRDHLKTSIVGRSLAPHILIQPKENNIYFPGCQDKTCRYRREASGADCDNPDHRFDGSDTRILLGYETATNAQAQLRWIAQQWEGMNATLRALWPQKCWDEPKRQAKVWNQERIVLPRPTPYPEPSIDTIGVGGAVTGRHFNVHIFDDLCTLEAANSPVIMEATVEWFKASRALLDEPTHSLEFTIGTRWAVHDLYEYIIRDDHTVEHVVRSVIENGKPIFPEVFNMKAIQEKKKLFGSLFPLLYMNSAADASLVDFDMTDVRYYTTRFDGRIIFNDNEKDDMMAQDLGAPKQAPLEYAPGTPMAEVYKRARETSRDEYMKLKYGNVRSA